VPLIGTRRGTAAAIEIRNVTRYTMIDRVYSSPAYGQRFTRCARDSPRAKGSYSSPFYGETMAERYARTVRAPHGASDGTPRYQTFGNVLIVPIIESTPGQQHRRTRRPWP